MDCGETVPSVKVEPRSSLPITSAVLAGISTVLYRMELIVSRPGMSNARGTLAARVPPSDRMENEMSRQQGDEHSQDMHQQTQDESWDPQDLQDLGPFDEEQEGGQQGSGEASQKQPGTPDRPGGRQAG